MKIQIIDTPKMKRGGKTSRRPVQQQDSGQQRQIMQLIQMYAQKHRVDPKLIMQKLQQLPPEDQKNAIQQMAQEVQTNQQTTQVPQEQQEEQQEPQQNPQEEMQEQSMKGGGWISYAVNPGHGENNLVEEFKEGGDWIKGAVNPAHKGYCTPMTKSTCTPRRKAFAMRAKAHFKEEGGGVGTDNDLDYGGIIPSYKQGGSLHGGFGVPEHTRAMSPGISPVNYNVGKYDPRAYKPFSNQPEINIGPKTYETNASMGPVEPEYAKIEAEKGEKIVKPDLSGIWQIGGKRHSEGGTPLNPEPGSFIFSRDPKLAITPQEKTMMKLKEGGSTARSKNTPSHVLGKNINIKEYNRYQSILQNPKAEPIAKATAALMVDKYQKIMGQIAFLQENKKGTQAPNFSQGTSPNMQPDIQREVDEQEMYQTGGLIFPQFQQAGVIPDYSEQIRNARRIHNRSDIPDYRQIYDSPEGTLFDKQGNKITKFMGNEKWIEWLKTPAGRTYLSKPKQKSGIDYAYLPKQNIPDLINVKPYTPNLQLQPNNFNFTQAVGQPKTNTNNPNYPTLPYDIKGFLTDMQKADVLAGGVEAMGIRKYMPMHEHLDLPTVRLDKINPQPHLNAINNQQFQAYSAMNAANPRQAILAASNISGKGMDSSSQALGAVDTQNIGIGNQENLTNLQQRNIEQQYNIPADARYIDQVNTTNQNFDDERRYARNQVRGTLNKYQSDADLLAWANAAQGKWGRRKVIGPDGKPAWQPVPLFEYTKNGMRYNADVASLDMASSKNQINTPEELAEAFQKVMNIPGIDSKTAGYILGKMLGSKNAMYSNEPNQ